MATAALMQRARKAIREGHLVDARRLLRQVIHEDPQNHAAWLLLARATPDKKLAAQYIDRARHLQPDSPLVQRTQNDLDSNKTAATDKFSFSWLLIPILLGTLLLLGLAGINYRQNTSEQAGSMSFESIEIAAAAPADVPQSEPGVTFSSDSTNRSSREKNSPQILPSAGPPTQIPSGVSKESAISSNTISKPVVISETNQALPAAILMGIDAEAAASKPAATSEAASASSSTPQVENKLDEETEIEAPDEKETLDSEESSNAAAIEEVTIDTNEDEETAFETEVADVPDVDESVQEIEKEIPDPEGLESSDLYLEESAVSSSQAGPERWIDVNLTTQMLTAYEGDTAVLYSLISSGMWQFPTVTGQFHTWLKYETQNMTGYHLGYNYDLPDVPNVMYFYRDYAIHGAYWHNNFGTPMSHGCINVNLTDAEWLYNWAPLGTLVDVHY
jgi:lipoprotein-anchoring transpeptidase ErfK/SrfK